MMGRRVPPIGEVVIRTESLELVLETTEQVLARIAALSPAEQAEVSPGWLARVRASTSADPWTHGFSIVDRAKGVVIGSCGFKAPPDPEGVVEIAYGIDPAYRGRGYATQAAKALADFAFGSGLVRLVRAHTLPSNAASARVLAKSGFERVGLVEDPEDGTVWRWERRKGPA